MSILQKNPDFCQKHYKKIIQVKCYLRSQTLFSPVSRINPGSWMDQLSNMMGYLGKLFKDLCEIFIESHWNYQGVQMKSYQRPKGILAFVDI